MKQLKLLFLSVLALLLGTSESWAQDSTAFITTWSIPSDDLSLTIPTGGGTDITDFDFTINWGDGTIETITGDDPDPSHTYDSAGTYTVSISGTFPHMRHSSSDAANAAKLQTVDQWGDIQWEKMTEMFRGAENMTYNATDVPDLSQVDFMSGMFYMATNFNGDISAWDVSNVKSFEFMFRGASSFNADISSWTVSSATDMSIMFMDAKAFNQDIGGWNTGNVTDMALMFRGAEAFNQPLNNWDVSSVTDMESMFRDAKAFNQNINSWTTSSVIKMKSMFSGAEAFDQPLNNWDVSSVTDMQSMFRDAKAFNQNINSWTTASVTNMRIMFRGAEAFNQPLNNWDVSSVTDMESMFRDAKAFNQNINSWTTASVTNMKFMFSGAEAFDQPLDNWDVSSVTDMAVMFNLAETFNQPLNDWDVSSVTDMNSMFYGATAFNQDLNQWDVSSVTDMSFMFAANDGATTVFNGDISTWNTSSVTAMGGLFYEADAFNQDINTKTINPGTSEAYTAWDVSNVTYMEGVFYAATSFNQPLDQWDVTSVTDMWYMFSDASSFNQDLSSWDVSNVTRFHYPDYGFLERTALSTENYDALLEGWSQLTLQNGLTLDVGDTTYFCAATEARQSIIDTYGWTIEDGGLAEECPIVWTGAINSDWHTDGNWSTNTVPSSNQIALIPGDVSNMPLAQADVNIKDLEVETNATLSIKPTLVLKVNRDLINNGQITFKSDSTGDSYLDEFTGSITGTGDVVVEKYYPAKRAFRMVTSPVNSTTSIYDNWQNGGNNVTGIGTHITGSASGANGFDQTQTGNPSLFYFDNGWQAIANTNSTNLTAGTPYRLMVRGDRDPDLLIDNDATPNPTTLIATGELEVDVVTKEFPSATAGSNTFAFIANPYQSRIDVSEVLAANSNTDSNQLWVWDPMINTRGAFVTIDELSGNGDTTPSSTATKFIEPGQAFFIQLSGSDSEISFTESVKDVTTTLPNSAPFSYNQMTLLFELQNEGNQVIDAIRLRFAADGITDVDAADIAKMGNIDENLASVNQNSLFSIQRRNFPENDEVIPLFSNNWRNQDYSFMANLNNFGTTEVYLVDAYLGTETLLEDGQTYSFSVDESISESVDASRFSLKFDTETMGVDDEANKLFSLYPNPAQEMLNIQTSLALGTTVEVEIYNKLGQQVYTAKQELKSPSLEVDVSAFNSGVYIVKLTDEAGNQQSTQLIKK